jgi:hypothetical protein
MDCQVLDLERVGPCGADPLYLLIEKDGTYIPVCPEHITTDPDGMILPAIKVGEAN